MDIYILARRVNERAGIRIFKTAANGPRPTLAAGAGLDAECGRIIRTKC